jgi:HlyD family secretion protein
MNQSKPATRKPASRKNRAGWIAGLVMVFVVAAGAGWYFLGGQSRNVAFAATATPDYHTTTVRRGNIVISAAGAGNLIANQSADLSFSTGGTVVELDVKPGDTVTAGQVLAKISGSATLQVNLSNAQLKLLQAQQSLTNLQKNAGTSLANAYQAWIKAQDAYNTAVFNQQRTSYARCSQTTNQQLKNKLDNASQKLAELSISNQGTDAWAQAQSDYDTALANYNYCIAYTPSEKADAQAAVDVAKNTLQQAENTYNTLKASSGVDTNALNLAQATVDQAQAQVDKAKSDLTGLTLVAPFNGTVLSVAAAKGSIVGTSTFITIADLSQPTLDVSIDETDLPNFNIGSQAQVVFDIYPEQTFTGTLVQVDPQLTTSGQATVATGKVQIDASQASDVQKLPVGASASVTVIFKQANNALLVPISALRNLGNGQYGVFVLKNGQLKLTLVKVGLQDTASAEILSGLNVGDVVSTGIVQSK